MSENFTWREELKTNFKLNLDDSFSNNSSLHYIYEQRSGRCLVVTIPHKVLLKWRDLKKVIGNVSYVKFPQVSTSHLPFMLKDSNERVENDLQCLVSKVYNQSRALWENTRVTFLNKTRSIHVSHDELVNAVFKHV